MFGTPAPSEGHGGVEGNDMSTIVYQVHAMMLFATIEAGA
jgi:hypothetical protein